LSAKVRDVHEIMNFFLIGAIFKRSNPIYPNSREDAEIKIQEHLETEV